MKYTQYSRERKGSSAFYIILVVCLIVIGIAAWVAFSNMNTIDKADTNSNINSTTSKNNSEYNGNTSSYNESVPDVSENQMPQQSQTQPTADEVKDEPYEAEPVKSYTMPINGDILKDFSTTALQYSQTYGDMRIHNAVDITATEGTLVSACTDGTVQSVEETANYGNVVTIDHGDGLVIKYAALKDITVKSGDTVQTGNTIGAVSTVPCECDDQSHLHLEAYKNGDSISILSLFE